MKTLSKTLTLSLFTAAAVLATSAQAAPQQHGSAEYGMNAPANAASREVVINPGMRYVNVANGETVRFNVDGQSFAFDFDAWPNDSAVDLAAIAPSGVKVPKVEVYIAPNPLYNNG